MIIDDLKSWLLFGSRKPFPRFIPSKTAGLTKWGEPSGDDGFDIIIFCPRKYQRHQHRIPSLYRITKVYGGCLLLGPLSAMNCWPTFLPSAFPEDIAVPVGYVAIPTADWWYPHCIGFAVNFKRLFLLIWSVASFLLLFLVLPLFFLLLLLWLLAVVTTALLVLLWLSDPDICCLVIVTEKKMSYREFAAKAEDFARSSKRIKWNQEKVSPISIRSELPRLNLIFFLAPRAYWQFDRSAKKKTIKFIEFIWYFFVRFKWPLSCQSQPFVATQVTADSSAAKAILWSAGIGMWLVRGNILSEDQNWPLRWTKFLSGEPQLGYAFPNSWCSSPRVGEWVVWLFVNSCALQVARCAKLVIEKPSCLPRTIGFGHSWWSS